MPTLRFDTTYLLLTSRSRLSPVLSWHLSASKPRRPLSHPCLFKPILNPPPRKGLSSRCKFKRMKSTLTKLLPAVVSHSCATLTTEYSYSCLMFANVPPIHFQWSQFPPFCPRIIHFVKVRCAATLTDHSTTSGKLTSD